MVNGEKIPVQRGMKYVTINMNSTVQGWFEKPYLWDGYWHAKDYEPLGIRLGYVELDDGDEWTYTFEVQN
jgi:hypothetical protein